MSVVLIVSPSDVVHVVLSRVMSGRGRTVSLAMTGTEGMELLRQRPFELTVVDPMVPDMSVWSLVGGLTELEPVMPIHILPPSVTADRVPRHEWSPLRYLFPATTIEDSARLLDGWLTRSSGLPPTPFIVAGALTLEPESGIVSIKSDRIVLANRESVLLRTLMTPGGHVRSLTELHEAVCGEEPAASVDAVVGTLRNLRRKLPPGLIESIFGRGYRLRA